MTDLLSALGFETGLISSTLADSEFDAVSVGAGATFQAASVARGASSLYSLQSSTGGSSVVAYGEIDWGSDETTIYLEIHVRFATVPSAITYFLSIYDSTPAVIGDLGVDASGHWIWKNAGDATTYASTGQVVVANEWYRVELKLVANASTGTIDVSIDGILEPGLSGLTGKNTLPGGSPRRYRVGVTVAQANAPTRYLDDVIVRNGGWVGHGFVNRLIPMGNHAGGANWTVVDGGSASWQAQRDVPWASSNSGLIKSSTANQEERYILNPLAQTSTGLTIYGLIPLIRHKRTTVGSAAAAVVNIRSGATEGTTASLDAGNATWTTKRGAVQDVDPATSAAWTLSAINAALLRIVHDAGTNEGNVNASLVYCAYIATGGFLASGGSKTTRSTPSVKRGIAILPPPDPYIRRGRSKRGGQKAR